MEGSEDYSGFAVTTTHVVDCVTCSTHTLAKPLPRGVAGREGPGAQGDENYDTEIQENCNIKIEFTQEAEPCQHGN